MSDYREAYERWVLMPLVFGILIVVGIPVAIVLSPLWIIGELGIRVIFGDVPLA